MNIGARTGCWADGGNHLVGGIVVPNYWYEDAYIDDDMLYGGLEIADKFNPKGENWEICVTATTNSSQVYAGVFSHRGVAYNSSVLNLWFSSNGLPKFLSYNNQATHWFASVGRQMAIGVENTMILNWDGTRHNYVQFENGVVVSRGSVANTTQIDFGDGIDLNVAKNANPGWTVNGPVSLAKCYITIGGKIWWEGAEGAYNNINITAG